MLLDLGLRGPSVSTPITPTSTRNDMDFPAFLLLYASLCGLCVRGAERGTEKGEEGGLWVPTRTGDWQKVSQTCGGLTRHLTISSYLICYASIFFISSHIISSVPLEVSEQDSSKLLLAARPYSIRTASDQNSSPTDIWVSTDDISDIFLLAGVYATASTVDRSMRAMTHFLPGVTQGKLCFQVGMIAIPLCQII